MTTDKWKMENESAAKLLLNCLAGDVPRTPPLFLSFSPAPRPLVFPSQLAAACEIAITYETLLLAFGRVIYLAEAALQPPRITVNTTAIAKLVAAAAQAPPEHRAWFTEATIAVFASRL